jgi:integrase
MREVDGRLFYRFRIKGFAYSGALDEEATVRGLERATRRLVEIREACKAGRYEEATISPMPFSNAVGAFLDWKAGEVRSSTVRRIAVSFSSALVFFGGMPIHTLHAGKLEDYKAARRGDGIREITLKHDMQALRQLLDYGVKQRWLPRSPMAEVARVKADPRREFLLDAESERYYLAAAQAVCPDLADFARLLLLTGMRPGELMALRWSSIVGGCIVIGQAKTDAGNREIPVLGEIEAVLQRRAAAAAKSTKPGAAEWIFPGDRGEHRKSFQFSHNKALESSRQSWVLYSLRHTAISRWVNGTAANAYQPFMSLPVAQKLAGHRKIETTMRYVKTTGEAQRAGMARFLGVTDPQPEGSLEKRKI